MNSLPDALARLLDHCQSLAKLLLDEQDEFYPFGTYLSNENVITQSMFNDGDDYPLSTGLIQIIKYDFDQQLTAQLLLASAVTYAARITGTTGLREVIVVRLNAVQLASALLCYLPYQLVNGAVEYGSSWIESEQNN